MNLIMLKRSSSNMSRRVSFCLLIFILSALMADSIIFERQNRVLSVRSSLSKFSSTNLEANPKLNLSFASIGKSLKDVTGITSNLPQEIPSNKPSGYSVLESLKQGVKYLNLNLIQRSAKSIPTNFLDQADIVYTSDLHLISALGVESGSKSMEYIKAKVENNRKMIFEHNYSKKKPYTLSENKFIIYTSQEFSEIYLTLKEPSNRNPSQSNSTSVIPPSKSNLRNLEETTLNINWKTAKKVNSVKFQQSCGACYSFTALGAIESAFLIKNVTLNLAEQQIIDCSTPYDNYGCIGGWTINSYRYIKDWGVLFESDYPYIADFGNCSVPSNKQKYKIQNYVELANDCNIVIEALKKQPLSIAVNSDGWMYYSSGLYTDCREGPSNHGVVLAGVDSSSWLIKNSWGFTWGESGYMRLSRTAPNDACNVCRWASYPVI